MIRTVIGLGGIFVARVSSECSLFGEVDGVPEDECANR